MGISDLFRRSPATSAPTRRRSLPINAAMAREFEMASGSRLLADWNPATQPIDAHLRNQLGVMQARAWHLYHNSPTARRFVDHAINQILGPRGFVLQAAIMDQAGNVDRVTCDAVEKGWRSWSRGPADYLRRDSFAALVRTIWTHILVDGEALVYKRHGKGAGPHGFSIQVLDPRLLDTNYNVDGEGNSPRVVMGVEIDDEGRPVAYHLLQRRDPTTYSLAVAAERVRIPAGEIIHLFRRHSSGQHRGIPPLAPVAAALRQLDKFYEAALVAARNGAANMGFLESEDNDDIEGEIPVAVDPGVMVQLPTGVKFNGYDPTYPTGEFGEFIKAALRQIAAGLGVSYHGLAQDPSGVNLSTARLFVQEERDRWMGDQEWFTDAFLRPVFGDWLGAAVLRRDVIPSSCAGRLAGMDAEDVATWGPRRWEWADPAKDAKALETQLQNELIAPSEGANKLGLNYEEQLRLRARDKRLRAEILGEDEPADDDVDQNAGDKAGKTAGDDAGKEGKE